MTNCYTVSVEPPVEPSPEVVVTSHPRVAVEYNKDVVLKCRLCDLPEFSEVPGIYATWERVGRKIATERVHKNGCTLVISKTTLQDAGNYTCTLQNKSHIRIENIPLLVQGEKQTVTHTNAR